MSDEESIGGVNREDESVSGNHLYRMLAMGLQVVGGVVPFGMEITLRVRRHPSSLHDIFLALVPWTSLLSVIVVCLWCYINRGKNKGGGMVRHLPPAYKDMILVFALLHMGFSFFSWLKAIKNWEFGDQFTVFPLTFATLLLVVSVADLR
ncbi:hypothetical protein ABFS82_08G201000 [Erythranthe guttata]|uniref:uncharacterized protein LOC105970360 n=1 Tax=Erythranthe guttata TaxID=4155 RepID=UPI00064DCEC2|nr:PREDICTED: uncharacterized protein LOC105970360 [Erythranthe guttata]|eukprot:XP_012850622.1 PREDICTED: uncharacterized protein LOC105970360 [Erythranthe guttata]